MRLTLLDWAVERDVRTWIRPRDPRDQRPTTAGVEVLPRADRSPWFDCAHHAL